MSEYESPERLERDRATVDDVRELVSGVTPHFAPHVRNRLRRLVRDLPAGDPVRVLAEDEALRVDKLAVEGERRGTHRAAHERPLLG